jgi:diphosphoinositol-polyphosphate diphosphatase
MCKSSLTEGFRSVPIYNNSVVLVASSNSKKRDWILPKGGWEEDETAPESAAREAYEEAGVRGEIIGPALCETTVRKNHQEQRMSFFALNVTELLDEWPESNRSRCVCSVEEALQRCTRPEMVAAMLECCRRGTLL